MSLETPANRLQWAREKHGAYKTPTAAAKARGWTLSTYLGHENGDRNPSRAAAIRYGKAYHVRWEWILEAEGSPTNKATAVKIVGYVGPGSQVYFHADNKIRETMELPPGVNATTAAFEVCGGSMRGIADDGWLIFFDDVKNPPTAELVGKLCIVELGDGKVLVRTLQPGRKRGRYDLESATEATMRDQRVVWAARVTWIKPR